MDERVLITGGAGFIGLHLARALVARGAHVTLLDNFFRHDKDAELRALLPDLRLIEHDLTTPLTNVLADQRYTQVYHLAAVVGVRYSNDMPLHVLRTNLLTTLNVLDWCAQQDRATLCFASTSEIYAGSVALELAPIPTPERVPLAIEDHQLPRASYAASKLVGEMACVNQARATGLPVRIVRYHNVYGPRMGYEHVIPQFIERVLERQNPFNIYGAYQSRAFCYVEDAVAATLQVMALPDQALLTVNIGNDAEETQILDLAHQLFSVADFQPELAIHAPPPGSPERRCPNLEYLRRVTSYQPQVPLMDGLRRTYDWYREASLRRVQG